MITSRAAIADGQGGFKISQIEIASPASDEVLVEIKAAGLCHTDWDSIENWDGPFIIGHEGAGIVKAIGPDVTKFAVGDSVILNWAIPCRTCHMCDEGLFPLCEVSSPANGQTDAGKPRLEATTYEGEPIGRSFNLGTMSEFTLVKEAACQPMKTDVPFPVAAIMGCGVMTGFGSVMNAAKVSEGASVAVLGCGGIGLNVIQAAAIAKAKTIIAIDIAEDRLHQAKSFGATHTVLHSPSDAKLETARKAIWDLTKRGADYAFECTAVPELGAAPLALIRHGGTAVQVSGIEQTIPFDCSLFEWDKTYINPLYGQCDPDRDFERLQVHYLAGELTLDDMITKTYAFDELDRAFEDLLAGRLAKGVLIPGGA